MKFICQLNHLNVSHNTTHQKHFRTIISSQKSRFRKWENWHWKLHIIIIILFHIIAFIHENVMIISQNTHTHTHTHTITPNAINIINSYNLFWLSQYLLLSHFRYTMLACCRFTKNILSTQRYLRCPKKLVWNSEQFTFSIYTIQNINSVIILKKNPLHSVADILISRRWWVVWCALYGARPMLCALHVFHHMAVNDTMVGNTLWYASVRTAGAEPSIKVLNQIPQDTYGFMDGFGLDGRCIERAIFVRSSTFLNGRTFIWFSNGIPDTEKIKNFSIQVNPEFKMYQKAAHFNKK